MTNINSSSMMIHSPRAMMDARIAAATSAGTISETDQTALENALDSIDSSLASGSAGTKPSGDIKERIDSLIAQQVETGTLTEEQAEELQSFFAEGPDGGAGPVGAAGGPRGPSRPPLPEFASSDLSGGDASSETSEVVTQKLDALITFLSQLRESLSNSTYGTDLTGNAANSNNTGLVVDTTA